MSGEIELVKRVEGEVVVKDPFSDGYISAGNVMQMIASARQRLAMRKEQVAALGELGDAPTEAVKEMLAAVNDDDKLLQRFDADFRDALVELAGFKAFVVQTRGAKARVIDPLSVRGGFRQLAQTLSDALEAAKPKVPPHCYAISLECTDAQLEKIMQYAVKSGATNVKASASDSAGEHIGWNAGVCGEERDTCVEEQRREVELA